MVSAQYSFSIASDTPQGEVDPTQLSQEVTGSSLGTTFDYISTFGDIGTLWFTAPLPSDGEDILKGLLQVHTISTPVQIQKEIHSLGSARTTSRKDIVMDGMSLIPGEGTYLVRFSTSTTASKRRAEIVVSIYAGGVQIPHTQRRVRKDGSQNQDVINTQTLVSDLGAGQTIEVRWRVSKGTAIVYERSLILQDA